MDLLVDEAGVEEEEEDGGRVEGVGEREDVLDGGVLGVEFAGEVGFGDGVVVRGEVVALVAEGADPDLGGEVDAGEGVEGGGAGLTTERGVREAGDVRVGTDQSHRRRQRDHALARFNLRTGPHVPRHADSVESLGIWARHLRHRSSFDRSRTDAHEQFNFRRRSRCRQCNVLSESSNTLQLLTVIRLKRPAI